MGGGGDVGGSGDGWRRLGVSQSLTFCAELLFRGIFHWKQKLEFRLEAEKKIFFFSVFLSFCFLFAFVQSQMQSQNSQLYVRYERDSIKIVILTMYFCGNKDISTLICYKVKLFS